MNLGPACPHRVGRPVPADSSQPGMTDAKRWGEVHVQRDHLVVARGVTLGALLAGVLS